MIPGIMYQIRICRRESEAAVKRSDLANFDPDTPLEKLGWAREEMQRNFQQPMSARTMRVCTVCSERWDTAEDGGGDYRRVVCCINKKEHTYRGYHLPWRKNEGKKKNGKKKTGKKKEVPSIELANFDWIV